MGRDRPTLRQVVLNDITYSLKYQKFLLVILLMLEFYVINYVNKTINFLQFYKEYGQRLKPKEIYQEVIYILIFFLYKRKILVNKLKITS